MVSGGKDLGFSEYGIVTTLASWALTLAAIVVLPPLVCLTDRQISESQIPRAFQGRPLRLVTNRFPGPIIVLTVMGFIALTAMGFGQQNGH